MQAVDANKLMKVAYIKPELIIAISMVGALFIT